MSAPAIEVHEVHKRYPKVRRYREALLSPFRRESLEALSGVSLTVAGRSVHGLLGANGAGKTTLLKILATLVLPTSGTARVAGIDVSEHPERVRERIGLVVADERSFYWRLSGRQNLEFFAALQDVPSARRRATVDELLGIVGLTDGADRPFREYSSGMRQRLSIARGLLADPEIVLMDEPTRALDPPSAAWIRRFIREQLVGDRGHAVVMATHDLHEAETTCDALTLVDEGRVVASGTVAELKRPFDRASRSTLTILAPADELAGRLRSGALGVAVDEEGERWRLGVSGGEEVVAAAVSALVAWGARIVEVRAEETPLSELFDRVASHRPEGRP